MAGKVVEVTDSTFDSEVLKSSIPVLVDFWAPWCGPCKALAPVLEEIANEYEGRLKVAKVNMDDNQEFAARYQVRGIPNLVLVKNGELKEQIVGNVPKAEIVGRINKVV